MTSTAVSAQGSRLEIGTQTDKGVAWTRIKNVKSFSGFDGQAAEIDVTDLDSTAKEFRTGLQDHGNFQFDINVNRTDPGQLAVEAARKSGAVTPFRLTLPDKQAATFDALVKSTPLQGSVDAVLTGSVTLRITGDVKWSE